MLSNEISVALCTYNGARFIEDQLNSILDQDLRPNEIVICDDNSDDDTLKILQSFKEKTSTINIIIITNKQRLGVIKNFEKAVTNCSGDYIFLCDQDDIWHKNKIQKLIDYFHANSGIDIVFTNANLTGNKSGTLWKSVRFQKKAQNDWKKYGSLFAFLRYKSICTGASMAFRKTSREYILPFLITPYLIHDGWIGIAAAAKNKIAYLDQMLYDYRIHEQQWTEKNQGRTNSSLKEDINLKCQYIGFFISYFDIKDPNVIALYNHYKFRQNLSGSMLTKVLPVTSEMISGNYFKFSNGLPSIIRDLVS